MYCDDVEGMATIRKPGDSTCQQFVECGDEAEYVMECPDGFAFNPACVSADNSSITFDCCDWPKNVFCDAECPDIDR